MKSLWPVLAYLSEPVGQPQLLHGHVIRKGFIVEQHLDLNPNITVYCIQINIQFLCSHILLPPFLPKGIEGGWMNQTPFVGPVEFCLPSCVLVLFTLLWLKTVPWWCGLGCQYGHQYSKRWTDGRGFDCNVQHRTSQTCLFIYTVYSIAPLETIKLP